MPFQFGLPPFKLSSSWMHDDVLQFLGSDCSLVYLRREFGLIFVDCVVEHLVDWLCVIWIQIKNIESFIDSAKLAGASIWSFHHESIVLGSVHDKSIMSLKA